MPLTEAQVIEALTVGSNAAFTEGLGTVEPQWNKIASKVPSSGSGENYGWLKDLPGIKEWVGDRQLVELGSHGYAIPNVTYEASIKIKREDIEDDKIGKYAVLAKGWGRESAIFPDENCFGLLALGFETLCYDGQNYFDTDHPVGNEAADVFSNIIGDPLDDLPPWFLIDDSQILLPILFQDRKPLKLEFVGAASEYAWFNNMVAQGVDGRAGFGFSFPHIAVGSKSVLDEANFEAGTLALASMKKSNDKPAGTMAKVLVVGPKNASAARKIIAREYLANGETNIYYNNVKLVVSPFLK
ncbi:Mu-like prophage major head subunit gpT family protein [Vibrio gazogenes]|uniref:Mu-like prophage major head subunit gpT n=1 Tax=Vibrio gazogenes DSM 21264 = NBRC 103151 TaxID=1123492 RepID=A0A1M5F9L2_VIBGA|nr:Mu-like prophage major head subunit gpT family protein [Vibrio gazogenes]USP15464.1 Mu-like prophage major head subunit gpT family protein [Vibrio gazogenes]SHF88169.1 Mu-like prophage major head subunit gpT [Vibrio gazogenes DSM 21264] [Vibrio gazogenes DSM 21264 = NBRC 103151]SJN54542.1 Mu-like prophage major head subunit gpT [Vibrio gazogenes]